MISRALLNAPFFIPKDADLLRNRKVNTKKRQNRHLPEFGTIVVVSLYTNEEILCTGSREEERVYVGEFPVAAINSLRRRIA